MAKRAKGQRTTRAPLSAIFRDSTVRAAFERAEQDQGPEPLATVILAPQHPTLLSGAAEAALPPEERVTIEDAIQSHLDEAERLIARLDREDGDPELCGSEHDGLEPDNDSEPSIGWPEFLNQDRALRACVGWASEQDMEQDNSDSEPSLGSPLAAMHDQIRWAAGNSDDREESCEGEGEDADVLECEPWAIFK